LSEHIVVSCRMNGEEVGRPESRYLDRARALTQHAEALGATLAAWSATTLAFAWDTESLEEAIQFACEASNDVGGEGQKTVWACAVARGELAPLAGSGDKSGGRADLAWGEPLVAAVILARAARAGEVLIEASFGGLSAFVATGKRSAQDGERRVRGVRIDPRQPWRRDVGAGVERMVTPPFVGNLDVAGLLARPGLVHVLRADPGQGGTRVLAELGRAVAPGVSIVVSPAGASVEPLGALRRALVRALVSRPYPDDPELAPVLDMFLGGIGASIEQAAAILGAFLCPRTPAEPPGALLLDDAGEIDAESLEACAQVVAWMASPFHVFVRIDATDQLPGPFAALPVGREIELGPLDVKDAEALARGATGGALGGRSARRIARRAAYGPLAIVEEIAFGLTKGEVVWAGDRAQLLTAASLAGKPAGAERWIAKRAKATAPDERGVLATIALLGGEAPLDTVRDALGLVEPSIAVDEEVRKLSGRNWLVEGLPGWVALPSRTHRDTIADLLDEAPRRVLHCAIADVLEQSEGELGCAEAANHAVKGGDAERGARLALRAARAAQAAGMAKSASRLLTLARLADPKCEPLTRQQLLTSLPPPILPPSVPPSSRARALGPPPLGPPPPPPAAAKSPPADVPPPRPKPLDPARAAPPVAPFEDAGHDSDLPTMIKKHALAIERPGPERLDRPTEPDPVPAYVLQPPPRAATAPRMSNRGMPAVAPSVAEPPGLPKPSAPLPLRPSVQSMPAVEARRSAPEGGADPAAPRVVASARVAQQISAVRPPPPVPPAPAPAPVAPPLVVVTPAAPVRPAPPLEGGEAAALIAVRMIDLAKSALVEGDAAGVDRWTEGLRAAGEHDRLAERIEALARISRGQVGEALRSLRALRDDGNANGVSRATRAQTTLALGLALAAANRPDDALLEGLDALARAREGGDARAAGVCLAFLAKLYGRAQRKEDAGALAAAAKGQGSSR
jgi:hypothetical protein